MNAAVVQGASPSRLVEHCDSVTLCLNKGLGAPMGSLVVGAADFIDRSVLLHFELIFKWNCFSFPGDFVQLSSAYNSRYQGSIKNTLFQTSKINATFPGR